MPSASTPPPGAASFPVAAGGLLGYFLPWQGTNYVGWGLIAFDGLAAYETYQVRLREDPDGRANFAFAQTRRFIVKEERNFVEAVDEAFGSRRSGPISRDGRRPGRVKKIGILGDIG